MNKQCLLAVVALVLVLPVLVQPVFVQPVFAAANPWLGTWKLNRDKSTLTGTTYTVTKNGSLYHFEFASVKYDIGEDGKDYPTMPTQTASLKPTGKNEWLEVDKLNGKEVSHTDLKLSDDGKTLTSKVTGTHADGTTYKQDYTDERVSGGPGLAGTFKNTKDASSATSIMIYSDAGPGKLKIDYPSSKGSIVFSLDGKPSSRTGPRAVPDTAFSRKQVSPTELKMTYMFKGKLVSEGVDTVSADGKTLKEVFWLVTKPNEKTTYIYEKQ